MFKYETHLHTSPVSQCASASPEEAVDFYKSLGYDGIFVTNHFIDGNIDIDRLAPYSEKIEYYFSDYEKAKAYGDRVGLKVFSGVEMSHGGTDFLVYGLNKKWFLSHPEIMNMRKSAELAFLRDNGAFIVQAHPFREAGYIDHIRLYPRVIDGSEVINANRTDFENRMAEVYAESYNLFRFAGSDNHVASKQKRLAGMMCARPIKNEKDFISAARHGELQVFTVQR